MGIFYLFIFYLFIFLLRYEVSKFSALFFLMVLYPFKIYVTPFPPPPYTPMFTSSPCALVVFVNWCLFVLLLFYVCVGGGVFFFSFLNLLLLGFLGFLSSSSLLSLWLQFFWLVGD